MCVGRVLWLISSVMLNRENRKYFDIAQEIVLDANEGLSPAMSNKSRRYCLHTEQGSMNLCFPCDWSHLIALRSRFFRYIERGSEHFLFSISVSFVGLTAKT